MKGFSLLETLVVIIVIAVLVAAALPYYFNAVESARATEVVSLWGRTKNWAGGQNFSLDQAQRLTNRLNTQKLKYFTGTIICRPKDNPAEICWEAEFLQQNPTAHARYKLVTSHNFMNLLCVPLNNAGEDFCISRTQDEKNTEQIGNEKGFLIH